MCVLDPNKKMNVQVLAKIKGKIIIEKMFKNGLTQVSITKRGVEMK